MSCPKLPSTFNKKYTGTTKIALKLPQIIKAKSGDPPWPIYPNNPNPGGFITTLGNINTMGLKWTDDFANNLPPFSYLEGKSIDEVKGDGTIIINLILEITNGSQGFNDLCSGSQRIDVSYMIKITPRIGTTFEKIIKESTIDNNWVDGNENTYCPNGVNCAKSNDTFTVEDLDNVLSIRLIPYNFGSSCANQEIKEMQVNLTVVATLTTTCGGDNLNTGLCYSYCNTNLSTTYTDNYNICKPAYLDYCFNDNTKSVSNICTSFVKNYVSQVGPDNDVDCYLNKYCTGKYTNLGTLDNTKNANDRILCGCQMNEAEYTNFANQIFDQGVSGLGISATHLGLSNRCLYPLCGSQIGIPTKSIGKACKVPQCLNITSINNNGTIDGGVSVKQTSKCSNVTQNTSGGGGGSGNGGGSGTGTGNGSDTDKTFMEKYWWIFVVLIIIIIIIIFAVLI